MKIELLGRFEHPGGGKSPEEIEEDRLQSLLDSDYVPRKVKRYVYDPFVMELEDIETIIRLDRTHSQISTYGDRTFIVKLPYNQFVPLYEQFTGKTVLRFEIKEEQIEITKEYEVD